MAFRPHRSRAQRRPGLLVPLALVVATLASISAAIALARTQPTTLFTALSQHSFQVRPGSIVMGADGGVIFGGPKRQGMPFGHIRWQEWGKADARGTDIEWVDNCNPNCAQGTYKNHGLIKLHAWRAVHDHFTRLSVDGPRLHKTPALGHTRHGWYWK